MSLSGNFRVESKTAISNRGYMCIAKVLGHSEVNKIMHIRLLGYPNNCECFWAPFVSVCQAWKIGIGFAKMA